MKVAFIEGPVVAGSRYKFKQMFSRLVDITAKSNWTERELLNYDLVICFGDRWPHWKLPYNLGIPYLLISQDCHSMRTGGDGSWEKEQVGNAGAVLFTTEAHRDWLGERMDLPPHEIVYLRPLIKDLEFDPLPKIPNTVVYAGGLAGRERITSPYAYRIYTEPFKALIDGGWVVHAYQAWTNKTSPHLVTDYSDVVIHDPVPQDQLYKELSQYEVGFQGYGIYGNQFYVSTCRPNKLWEYQAAGIPTVGFNTGDGAYKVYDGKWGLVSSGLDDLAETARKASEIIITDEMRFSETMDKDLDKFEILLDYAINSVPKKERKVFVSKSSRPFEPVVKGHTTIKRGSQRK